MHAGRVTIIALALLVGASTPAARAGTGDLDPTFGSGGVVLDDFGVGTTGASRVVVQPDGGIVAVGSMYLEGNNDDLAVLRLLPDGSLDPTFGTGGRLTIDFGSSRDWVTTGLALQADSKLLVGGTTRDPFPAAPLVRLLPDGTPDPGFGVNGLVQVPCLSDAFIVLQPDDRIVVAGKRSLACPFTQTGNVAIARLLPDGSLDPSWGGTGVVHSSDFSFGNVFAVTVDPSGRVLVSGERNFPQGGFLMRHLADGTPDATFGTGGLMVFTDAHAFGPVVVQPDGKIAVVAYHIAHFQQLFGLGADLRVVRFDDGGALDPSFGEEGTLLTQIGAAVSRGYGVLLDPTGRLLVAVDGWVNFATPGGGVARLAPDGMLDPLFGGGGWTLTGGAGARDVALQADGSVVVVGGEGVFNGAFAIARYTTDCPALPDSDADGIGDACDACTGDVPFDGVVVKLHKLLAPEGDETLRISGRFGLAGPPAPDPVGSGLRVRVEAQDGSTIVDAVVPPGVFDPAVKVGWKANSAGTSFKYAHHHPDLPAPDGIQKAVLKALSTPNQYKVKIKGSGDYPATAAGVPLTATVIVKPPRGDGGECAIVSFASPPLPACKVNTAQSSIVCR